MKIKLSVLFLSLTAICVNLQSGNDLEKSFKNPPTSSMPRTWMHALDGNMSKEGLTKDFEAIQKVGIGGVLLFNISNSIPSGNVMYNSDKHIELLKHAAVESERLGLAFGVHNCDGWSASGGPWVTPEKSMKMVVYNEIIVNGGSNMQIQMDQPGTREGFYKDIAVLAYPSLPSELVDLENKPTISSSDKNLNLSLISDGKNDISSVLNGSSEQPGWIVYEYKKPFQLASLLVYIGSRGPQLDFFYSNDGVKFEALPKPLPQRPGKSEHAYGGTYKDISVKYIKIETRQKVSINEIAFTSTQHIYNLLGRISMHRISSSSLGDIGNPLPTMIIDKTKIINLTNSLDNNGKLSATLPTGKWTILRFGYTSTGARNHPATDSGRGLEVDKFSKDAIKLHYDAFVGRLVKAAKPAAPNAFCYVEIDSYEMGGQNWTEQYDSIFKAEYGYNLIEFLPLFAGRFVESPKSSDDVLWDVRHLNYNLMTECYFGYFTELAHKDGLKTYIEPYGNGPIDNLRVGGYSDIPMGEFWQGDAATATTITDPAVQPALIYGKNIVSMEAFTSGPNLNWKNHPALFKTTGDRIWTAGANEFMFHRFAHQANTHVVPGMTMGQWGTHFDRTNTWWDNAGKAWFKYIARGQYLLRQGVPVVDFLVLGGDRLPNSSYSPQLPAQYTACDVNMDVLVNRITVKNGKMTLPEGNQFRALILGETKAVGIKMLKRLNELASQGVVIIGEKPLELAGYNTASEDLQEFKSLVSSIWSKPTTINHYNWKEILPTLKAKPAFEVNGIDKMPFAYRKSVSEDIFFFYNTDSIAKTFDCVFNIDGKTPELFNAMNGEITTLAQFETVDGRTKLQVNLKGRESVFVVFRKPSVGIPIISNSNSNKALYTINSENKVELTVTENGTYNAKTSDNKDVKVKVKNIPTPLTLTNAWQVSFNKANGYDGKLNMPVLQDWSKSEIDEVKHYSGTATYKTTINIKSGYVNKSSKFELDLGKVCIAAKVKLNGIELGTVWMSPYKLDITKALKKGENKLEIEVTNLWTNRLIGDERLEDKSGLKTADGKMPDWYVNNQAMPNSERITFTTMNFYTKDKTLLPSGLIGPVSIQVIQNVIVSK